MMTYDELDKNTISLDKILKHFQQYKGTIFFISLLLSCCVIMYTYFLQSVYVSEVTISFSDQKISKLMAMTPERKIPFSQKKSNLETAQIILKTRKFINSFVHELNIDEHYYIENKFTKYGIEKLIKHKIYTLKKNEVYSFEKLDIKFKIFDKIFFDKLFEIVPISDKEFVLKNDKLKFKKRYKFGEYIDEKGFSIYIQHNGSIEDKRYFFKKNNKEKLADIVLKNLQVQTLSDDVLKLIYHDTVPKRAKEVISRIAKEFIEFTLYKKTNELTQTLKFLDKQINETEKQFKGDKNKLKTYQKDTVSILSSSSSKTLLESVSIKEEKIKNLKLQIEELSNFKFSLRENKLNTVSLLMSGINPSSIQSLIERFREDTNKLNEMELQQLNIEQSITQNPYLNRLIENLVLQKQKLSELVFNFTSEHPQVIKASMDMSRLEDEILIHIETNMQKLRQSQKVTKEKILNNIVMTQNSLMAKKRALEKDLTKEQFLLHSLPEKDLNIQELKRKFALSENVYTFLLQKKMEIEIAKASTIENTKVIEDAREALLPSKPNKRMIIVIGIFFSFILSMLLTVVLSFFNRKIKDMATLLEITKVPLYGTLPSKKKKGFFDEALKHIRTNIEFLFHKSEGCQIILVSSVVPEEGKTTVVSGLSKIISLTGKKVLMMDLDLRKPRLHQEFLQKKRSGITEYLEQDIAYDGSMITSINKNLDFFQAGIVSLNPSELLISKKFNFLLEELKKEYDYIIFDTPPIGSVVDAKVLLKYSTLVLFILKENFSQKNYVQKIEQLIIDRDIKNYGIILNKVKLNNDEGYGYGYGYK